MIDDIFKGALPVLFNINASALVLLVPTIVVPTQLESAFNVPVHPSPWSLPPTVIVWLSAEALTNRESHRPRVAVFGENSIVRLDSCPLPSLYGDIGNVGLITVNVPSFFCRLIDSIVASLPPLFLILITFDV